MNAAHARSRMPLLCVVIVLAFSATESAKAQPPGMRERVGPEAVWNPPREVFLEIGRECAGKSAGCLPGLMEQSAASAQAIEFSRSLGGEGYLEALRALGRVDLATIAYPFRANDNEVPALINGKPPVVDVQSSAASLVLAGDPYYDTILRRHPNARWLGDVPSFKEMTTLPQGGQRFVFTFALRDGCHACAILGKAWLAMDFDGAAILQRPVRLGCTDPGAIGPPHAAAQKEPQGAPASTNPVPSDHLIAPASVGPVRVGMTIAQAQIALHGLEVAKGTNGDGAVIYVVRHGTQRVMVLFPLPKQAWDPVNERTGIHGIEVYAPTYATAGGVHPGMRLRDLEPVFGKLLRVQRSEIESQEFALFPKLPQGMGIRVPAGTGIYAAGENTTTHYALTAQVLSIVVTWTGPW
ncbi:MAG TPA: hypothetical protein VKV57_05970 [bacterium]|nr:hypothetical protein [bacterium]